MRRFSLPLAALACLASPLAAQPADAPTFARIFGDHAVLQLDQPIAIWGHALAGRTVTVTLGGRTAKVRADARGRWRTTSPPCRQAGRMR